MDIENMSQKAIALMNLAGEILNQSQFLEILTRKRLPDNMYLGNAKHAEEDLERHIGRIKADIERVFNDRG